MRQLAVLAKLVDPPRANAEVLRDLGHLEQPIPPAPEDLQVGERGGHARPLSRLRRRRGALLARSRLRATVRERRARARYQMGTKAFRKACG